MRCPVCHEELTEEEKGYRCPNNHTFDKARSGYTNMLLNRTNSGDNKMMVNSRNTFLNKGYFLPLKEEITQITKSLKVNSILDLGCGDGYYDTDLLGNIIYGVDISKYAVDKASKRKTKNAKYFVANVMDLPFKTGEIDLLINVFAPTSPEITRVSNKYILKVIPDTNHLIELKEMLYTDVYLNSVKSDEFIGFSLAQEKKLSYKTECTDVKSLFQMTPYYYKTKDSETLEFPSMDLTFAFILRLYKKIED